MSEAVEQESQYIPEKEKFESRIYLAFFRHSIKGERPLELLTPEGKKLAKEKAKEYHPEEISLADIKQAVAFGSPRIRAQETAGFVLGGGKEEITGEEDLSELEKKLNEGLKYGTKIGRDKNLDFHIDEESMFGKKAVEAIKEKRWLRFLIEESDKLAHELDDKKADTYSRMAARMAQIIRRYIRAERRWDELVKKKGYQPTLERYLCSHQGVLECFLAKIIEKTRGIEERDKFVQILGNHGFDFLEGFKVEILNSKNDPENPEILITYQKKDSEGKIVFDFAEKISKDLIEEIIQEGKK